VNPDACGVCALETEVSHLVVTGLNEASESQGSKDLASRGLAGAGGSVVRGGATETTVACV
jgi:hypothetical protein